MKEATHIRRKHLMYTASGALLRDCKFINEAKRFSRELQKQGSVVRVEHKEEAKIKMKALTRDPGKTTLSRIRAREAHNWSKGGKQQ